MSAAEPQEGAQPPARGKGGRFKRRISANTKRAIALMVGEGLSRNKAAEKLGMNRETLRHALTQPHVKAFYRKQVEESFNNAGLDALRTMQRLMEEADSEHVQAKAAEWIAGVHGVSPVQKHSHHHSGEVGITQITIANHPRLGPDVEDAHEVDASD